MTKQKMPDLAEEVVHGIIASGNPMETHASHANHARIDLERKLFEAYAEPKGYNVERIPIDKYDAFKKAYKNDAVDHEWQGWKARADLQAELDSAPKPRKTSPTKRSIPK